MSEKDRSNEQRGNSDGENQEKLPAVSAGKRILLVTFGCQMNLRDSEVISGLLKQAGFSFTEFPEDSDILIFNTCSVRQHAEDRVFSLIGEYRKRREKANRRKGVKNKIASPVIGIVGCMAKNHQEKIFDKSSEVNFVVGPGDIAKIPGIINTLIMDRDALRKGNCFLERKIWETNSEMRSEAIYHTGFYENKKHAFIVISEGCSNFCSYCIVPYVRGPLHHRDYKEILEELKTAVDSGIREVTLLGQNVNAYKFGDVNFTKLLELVNSVKGLQVFDFMTSHPKDASTELFKCIAGLDKLKKALHLPVQSGSDRILKLMNRGYTRKFYLDLIRKYRKIVKGGELTTDIIVGFPTETKGEFKETQGLVKKVGFDSAYIFKYSPRPYTEAAKFMDCITKKEKERRHSLMLELQKKVSKRKK